jgi:haloacetate dehalogenase
MSELADLFPGFSTHRIEASGGVMFARAAGSGPPVVLLHGFGQTHVAWSRVAPRLAERFHVVALDLRGYGASDAPESQSGDAYGKRAMAGDVVDVMTRLGLERFSVVGHDRGANVGFRLALDHPERVSKLALLDTAPIDDPIGNVGLKRIGRARFMAQPTPKPEGLIGLDPIGFLEDALGNETTAGTLDAFDPRAIAHYHAAFIDPARIHAFCEDYRAGMGADRESTQADLAAGRTLAMPTLLLWGAASFHDHGEELLDRWRQWAPGIRGAQIEAGHFLAEEAPEATLAALLEFL